MSSFLWDTRYNDAIANLPINSNNSASFQFKTKIGGRTGIDGTKNIKIKVTLKYFSNFWRTLN